jgi:hypothetical protein
MSAQSKQALLRRIDQLESENEELRDKLDSIADVVNEDDEEIIDDE